jgi:hypothetical protein
MKTNKKHDQKMKNVPERAPEMEDPVGTPISRRTLLKTTMAASAAASLALLGGAEHSIEAQVSNSDERALNEYFRKGFNYADAKVLAAFWGDEVGDAKVRMGHKLLNLSHNDAMSFIREARGLALETSTVGSQQGEGYVMFPINYDDMGYEYKDVEALSQYWNTGVGETKLLLDTLLISGKDKDIQAALKNAKG